LFYSPYPSYPSLSLSFTHTLTQTTLEFADWDHAITLQRRLTHNDVDTTLAGSLSTALHINGNLIGLVESLFAHRAAQLFTCRLHI
jgi:hypothetical protein